jgi:hypothetical protein
MKKKIIGLWLDHTEARLIDPKNLNSEPKIIRSMINAKKHIPGETADGTRLGNNRSTNDESHKHYREQNELHTYYKTVAASLAGFDDILIFGPTTAKKELQNYLLNEKSFADKKITVEPADYLTENQMAARVRDFYIAEKHNA